MVKKYKKVRIEFQYSEQLKALVALNETSQSNMVERLVRREHARCFSSPNPTVKNG
jgi:hypothetical protein